MEKPSNNGNENDQDDKSKDSVWRRESDIRSELEKTREELERAAEHVLEVESKCDGYENRARAAEIRYRDAIRSLQEIKESQQLTPDQLEFLTKNPRIENELKIDTTRLLRSESIRLAEVPSSAVSTGSNGSVKSESSKRVDIRHDSPSPPSTASITREALVSKILEGMKNDILW
jgi:chromosome segregation ATPase